MFFQDIAQLDGVTAATHAEIPRIQTICKVLFFNPDLDIFPGDLRVIPGIGTEFNPTCGHSWKLDKYDHNTQEFSDLTVEFVMHKNEGRPYFLELLECGRLDAPAAISIEVNGQLIVRNFTPYNGDGGMGFWDVFGHQTNDTNAHLAWDRFEISHALQTGINSVRISLDSDTESGIAISQFVITTR